MGDTPVSTPDSETSSSQRRSSKSRSSAGGSKRRTVGIGAVVALLALAALVTWLVVESRGGDSGTSSTTEPPVALSQSGLETLARTLRQPIFWVGPQSGGLYEVAQREDGIYLRYLPSGADAGDKRVLRTVGTYPVRNAYGITSDLARRPGATRLSAPGGGIAVIPKEKKTSIFVAYPGLDYQIEVFDPKAAVARSLATGLSLQTVVGATQAVGPKAVSEEELAAFASSLGHPMYWAGPQPKTTYELTQTPDGRTFVRYLPAGVAVGTPKQSYLTVATYPLANAFTVTKTSSKGQGTVVVNAPRGGIGAYSAQIPTNIHLAYPGSDYQIEVYAPSQTSPAQLVAAGKIVPVG